MALEILSKLGVPVTEQDVGGTQGRKVVFDSHGGALLVVKVERLRAGDWYPGAAAAGGGASRSAGSSPGLTATST